MSIASERTLVVELFAAPEPHAACEAFLDLPHCLLLESVSRSDRLGRFSFVSADPFQLLRGKDGETVLHTRAGERRVADPFAALRAELARFATEPIPGLPPFQGGAAGTFAYDLLHHIERVPAPRFDDLALPDLCVGFFDWVIGWDHQLGRAWLVSTGAPEAEGGARERRAAERAAWVLRRLEGGAAPRVRSSGAHRPRVPTHAVAELPGLRSTFSREEFLRAVARTREYILAGDIFQANLSQRLEGPLDEEPWPLYLRLREHNPAPFAAFFDTGDAAVLSSSPERFLRLDGRLVETRPIKGTAPRGATPEADAMLWARLRESEKDRAENVMIVDLLRNDLSLVCEDASVAVPELCVVESYARVHHLVSAVTGVLREGRTAVDLLRSAFPGGSITGAPKIRAMEIIAELEPTRRGIYTGAIGYLGFDGGMDTNLAIRTAIAKHDRVFLQVGGGIVADSDPEREFHETIDKARAMAAALRGAAWCS